MLLLKGLAGMIYIEHPTEAWTCGGPGLPSSHAQWGQIKVLRALKITQINCDNYSKTTRNIHDKIVSEYPGHFLTNFKNIGVIVVHECLRRLLKAFHTHTSRSMNCGLFKEWRCKLFISVGRALHQCYRVHRFDSHTSLFFFFFFFFSDFIFTAAQITAMIKHGFIKGHCHGSFAFFTEVITDWKLKLGTYTHK